MVVVLDPNTYGMYLLIREENKVKQNELHLIVMLKEIYEGTKCNLITKYTTCLAKGKDYPMQAAYPGYSKSLATSAWMGFNERPQRRKRINEHFLDLILGLLVLLSFPTVQTITAGSTLYLRRHRTGKRLNPE